MDTTDRRKYQRVETSNLISYESIDKDGEIIFNSMGKALNVSQAGIMLEIAHLIKAKYVSLTTVDLENNLIKLKGQLIYCRKKDLCPTFEFGTFTEQKNMLPSRGIPHHLLTSFQF